MKEITVQELANLQAEGADFQFIDVREEYEYQEDNLGATLIPMGTIGENIDAISKDKQVVIHCRSGARSGKVVTVLELQFGFTNLYNLKGGIIAYRNELG
jgi:adenylyltransferase/sulfurtransferase